MGNDHHGDMLCCQLFDHFQDLTGQLRVKSGSRFIKEQNLRVHAKGSCNGNPLLLTAGKLERICILPVCQSHLFQQNSCLGIDFFFLSFLHTDRCICDIFQYGKMREKVEILKYQSHLSLFDDLAAVRCLKSCGAAKKSRVYNVVATTMLNQNTEL